MLLIVTQVDRSCHLLSPQHNWHEFCFSNRLFVLLILWLHALFGPLDVNQFALQTISARLDLWVSKWISIYVNLLYQVYF